MLSAPTHVARVASASSGWVNSRSTPLTTCSRPSSGQARPARRSVETVEATASSCCGPLSASSSANVAGVARDPRASIASSACSWARLSRSAARRTDCSLARAYASSSGSSKCTAASGR